MFVRRWERVACLVGAAAGMLLVAGATAQDGSYYYSSAYGYQNPENLTDVPARPADESPAQTSAEEETPEGKEEDECEGPKAWTLFPEECEFRIGGWKQAGYHDGSTGLFNDRPGKLNLHQTWLWIENRADGEKGFDIGYRADIVYGIDGADTQAFGNPPGSWDFFNGFDHGAYSWAIPQLYGEVAIDNLSVKIGHFFTLIGYEVVGAPGNFFYSHALTMYNSEPFTHTGALASYSASDRLTLHAGWTAGWDTGFEQLDGGSNWLGGFSYELIDDLTMTYISTAGDLGWRGEGYSHSLVFDWELNDRWHYVLQSDLVSSNGFIDLDNRHVPGVADDEIGINQYLFYHINCRLDAGMRVEWWKTDGVSFNEVTLGLNYKPVPNLVLRLEIRQQWCPTDEFDFEDNTVFGIDGYLTF